MRTGDEVSVASDAAWEWSAGGSTPGRRRRDQADGADAGNQRLAPWSVGERAQLYGTNGVSGTDTRAAGSAAFKSEVRGWMVCGARAPRQHVKATSAVHFGSTFAQHPATRSTKDSRRQLSRS